MSFIICAMFLVTLWISGHQKDDGLVINLAGRQRMLTQKMTKETLHFQSVRLKDEKEAETIAKQIKNTIAVFDKTLTALINSGDAPLSLNLDDTKYRHCPGATEPALSQLKKVQDLWRVFSVDLVSIINNSSTADEKIRRILKNNVPLLKAMDSAVGMMQKQSEAKDTLLITSQIIGITISICFAVFGIIVINRVTNLLNAEITKRKETAETLRDSGEKYRTLIENAGEAIIVAQDGMIKFTNPKGEELYGRSREELTSRPLTYFIHEEDREMVGERHKRWLKGEEPPTTYSFRIVDKNGNTKWVELSVVLFSWDDRPATLCFMTDITEKMKIEAQLQQAQRMESIGTLASGIAHNFNNILMGIIGNASLVLDEIDTNHPNYIALKNIEEQVKSGSKLTHQLLGYAREGRYVVKPLNLSHLVKDTSDTFGITKKEIRVHQDLVEDLLAIKVDQGQIEQVLLNLYVNAADAMAGGGDLYLKTMNVTDKDMTDKLYEPKPGNYVLLTIRDTGVGMDKETRERIFEPFFSTKGFAEGTGLGLASVYGTIKGHGGYIDVSSEKDNGTTFSIYFPATEEKVKGKKEQPGELKKGNGRILFVDDENMVLNVIGKMLRKMGYDVLSANNGQKALDLYKQNQGKIDLVLWTW